MVLVTTSPNEADPPAAFREPLRYNFEGYSITLTLEQFDNDLDKALVFAAGQHGLEPVPEPHVTLLYYIVDMTEDEVKRRFREEVGPTIISWPPLETIGLFAGTDPVS
jgi:hypothetical protein